MQCVENCDDPDVTRQILYEQPVWQTLQMFGSYPAFRVWHVYSYSYIQPERCCVSLLLHLRYLG